MSQDPLQQFAKQLHSWIIADLDKKPGPFRNAELLPTLLGTTGSLSPPIVFWINRESHLAGGVILLPKDNPTEVSVSGCEICAALGLDSYYTWGIGEVSAWKVDAPSGRLWAEPIPDTAMHETAPFRDVLTLLLQDMQNRFFSEQNLLPKLSSPYLTNLLHNCIESLLPVSAKDKDSRLNRNSVASVVLQMLALFSQTSSPVKTGPVRLISDLKHEIRKLAPPLFAALSLDEKAPPLSGAATIKLHHLYQRLQQLGPEIVPFMTGTITRLLQFWSEISELPPLPAPLKKGRSTLIINPDRYYPEMSVTMEIAAPPFSAATALLRYLQSPERRHPYQQSDLLDLRQPITVDEVVGNIKDRSKPTANEQAQLNTLLRHSWPNRHLKLAATTPRWAWRVIHLIGLLQGTPHGVLNLPADWLWTSYGEQFFNLISDQIDLHRISPVDNQQLRIEFNHPNKNQQITVDSFDKEVRFLDNQKQEVTRAELLLALSVPTVVYDLLRSGELKAVTQAVPPLDALELFLSSSIGWGLWQILNPKKQLPKGEKIRTEIVRTGFPLPGDKILKALSLLGERHPKLDRAMIDRELEPWLGSLNLSDLRPRFHLHRPEASPLKESISAEMISEEMIKTGEVPLFPENYLYEIPEKFRRSYSVSGLLSIRETFFNSVTMQTSNGESVTIEGVVTARALQLISTIKAGEFELPSDEHSVEIILSRYLNDLHKLYEQIQQKTNNLNPQGKNEIIEQIWNHLPVPPRS